MSKGGHRHTKLRTAVAPQGLMAGLRDRPRGEQRDGTKKRVSKCGMTTTTTTPGSTKHREQRAARAKGDSPKGTLVKIRDSTQTDSRSSIDLTVRRATNLDVVSSFFHCAPVGLCVYVCVSSLHRSLHHH
ncbi:hypothetical protein ZHAS_00018043 [Anopheles sinensis]|uniref:Uncharacterized protein n=1 Tax=Anopheles sinensis TaxID=74873 RepID=A0A084WIF8_ANOSI|nr:hypothetical protein ZHAS_00018043 [Anopheles sinensis]